MLQVLTGHPKVDAISQIHFEGNIVCNSWRTHIQYTNKRGTYTHHLALILLADIVYWYRASEVRNEETGATIGWKKKFKKDKLQKSYKALAVQMGASVEQVKEACKLLSALGLIELSFETVPRANDTSLGNVMFIDVCPEAIAAISYRERLKESESTPHPPGEFTHRDKANSPRGQGQFTRSYAQKRSDIPEITPETTPETTLSPLSPQAGEPEKERVENSKSEYPNPEPTPTPHAPLADQTELLAQPTDPQEDPSSEATSSDSYKEIKTDELDETTLDAVDVREGTGIESSAFDEYGVGDGGRQQDSDVCVRDGNGVVTVDVVAGKGEVETSPKASLQAASHSASKIDPWFGHSRRKPNEGYKKPKNFPEWYDPATGQIYPAFIRWKATSYKDQPGSLGKNPEENALSEILNPNKNERTKTSWERFLRECDQVAANAEAAIAQGMKPVLPPWFADRTTPQKENVMARLQALAGVAQVALPQGIATPSCTATTAWMPSEKVDQGVSLPHESKVPTGLSPTSPTALSGPPVPQEKPFTVTNNAPDVENANAYTVFSAHTDPEPTAPPEDFKAKMQELLKNRSMPGIAITAQEPLNEFEKYRSWLQDPVAELREKAVRWAQGQPNVILHRDANGNVYDLEKFN